MSKTQIPTNGIADDAVGNTKLDLTASYAFTGTITGASQFTLLSTQTADSDSTINFNNTLITSTYEHYMFVLNNLRFSVDGADIYYSSSADNGSSFPSSHSWIRLNIYDGTFRNNLETSQSSVTIFGSVDGTNANNSGANTGIIHLFNGNGTNTYKGGFSTMMQANQSGNANIIRDVKFALNDTADVNYVRFSCSSGNIADGTIKLYGVS